MPERTKRSASISSMATTRRLEATSDPPKYVPIATAHRSWRLSCWTPSRLRKWMKPSSPSREKCAASNERNRHGVKNAEDRKREKRPSHLILRGFDSPFRLFQSLESFVTWRNFEVESTSEEDHAEPTRGWTAADHSLCR